MKLNVSALIFTNSLLNKFTGTR